MEGLVRLFIEIVQYLWFFRPVEQTEHGCYFIFGRYWRTVGPGRWPMIPYFMDVKAVITEPGCFPITRQDIILRDGRTLTFSATFEFQVENPAAALTNVERWSETTSEIVSGVLADRLADVNPERFDPSRGKRDRLIMELVDELNESTLLFGVRIRRLWFTNFVVGLRTYRLVMES